MARPRTKLSLDRRLPRAPLAQIASACRSVRARQRSAEPAPTHLGRLQGPQLDATELAIAARERVDRREACACELLVPAHPLLIHEVATEVFLGCKRVVGTTPQREIG